jgi:hypothetical protein
MDENLNYILNKLIEGEREQVEGFQRDNKNGDSNLEMEQ